GLGSGGAATAWVAGASPRRTARAMSRAVAPTQVLDASHMATSCVAVQRRSGQCVLEICEEIIHCLDADRQPDQVGGYLQEGTGHARVGHPARMLDQRLHCTQRLAEDEQPGPVADRDREVRVAGLEADHAAEPAHLLG